MLTAGTAISTDDGRRIVRRAGFQRRGVCGFAGLGRFHRFGRAEDGRGGVPERGCRASAGRVFGMVGVAGPAGRSVGLENGVEGLAAAHHEVQVRFGEVAEAAMEDAGRLLLGLDSDTYVLRSR